MELSTEAQVLESPVRYPQRVTLTGNYVVLRPFESHKHCSSLYDNYISTPELWNCMLEPKPISKQLYLKHWQALDNDTSRVPFVISKRETPEDCIGRVTLIHIDVENRSIEIGGVQFSSKLKRTRQGTEALFLIMQYCIELGYERLVWTSIIHNEASRGAATRLGFKLQAIMRQQLIIKGYSCDVCWYSLLKDQWEEKIRDELLRWLAPSNFDKDGCQLSKLQARREH